MNQKKPNQEKTRKWIKRTILILLATILFSIIGIFFSVSMMYKVKNKGGLVTTRELEVIPFTYSNSGHILIPLQFDNDSTVYPFILDSGNSNMLFDIFPHQNKFPFSFFCFLLMLEEILHFTLF